MYHGVWNFTVGRSNSYSHCTWQRSLLLTLTIMPNATLGNRVDRVARSIKGELASLYLKRPPTQSLIDAGSISETQMATTDAGIR